MNPVKSALDGCLNSSEELASTLQFITFQNPNDVKDRSNQSMIRSHGIKRGIMSKRKKLKDNLNHFQVITKAEMNTPQQSKHNTPCNSMKIIRTVEVSALDPFNCLPVDGANLQKLLRNKNSQQVIEPVFSVSSPQMAYHVDVVFHGGFADPGFSAAVMFATLYAASGHNLTKECLEYRRQVLVYIQKQLSSSSATETTIGAILLLVGVAWRLNYSSEAQIHLRGIQKLVKHLEVKGIPISASLQRCIFWQDLNTCAMTGNERIFNNSDFPDIQWANLANLDTDITFPPSIMRMQLIFGEEFAKVLKHIYNLQCCCEKVSHPRANTTTVLELDDQQAFIESSLLSLLEDAVKFDDQLTCMLLACYLYTYSLFTEVWEASWIPSHIAASLLVHLENSSIDNPWRRAEDRWLWCVVVGGSLSPEGKIKSDFSQLLRTCQQSSNCLPKTWSDIQLLLINSVIWSFEKFGKRGASFWSELNAEDLVSI